MDLRNSKRIRIVWKRTWSGHHFSKRPLLGDGEISMIIDRSRPHPRHGGKGSRREKAIERQMISGVGENGGVTWGSKWLLISPLMGKIDQLEDTRGGIRSPRT
jgi:hypothetical protein